MEPALPFSLPHLEVVVAPVVGALGEQEHGAGLFGRANVDCELEDSLFAQAETPGSGGKEAGITDEP